MSKQNFARITIFLLILTIVASCMVSSTLAKYTSTAYASDIARVAKWSVNVGPDGGVNISDGVIPFNPFEYIYDTQRGPNGELVLDSDVKHDSVNPKIAPGTEGVFAFDIVNNSEVTAAYTVEFSINNPENVPLLFSLDGETWVDTVEKLNNLENSGGKKLLKNIFLPYNGSEDTVVVYWKWPYEQDGNVEAGNAHDTNIGIEHPTVEMSVTATVTQVD